MWSASGDAADGPVAGLAVVDPAAADRPAFGPGPVDGRHSSSSVEEPAEDIQVVIDPAARCRVLLGRDHDARLGDGAGAVGEVVDGQLVVAGEVTEAGRPVGGDVGPISGVASLGGAGGPVDRVRGEDRLAGCEGAARTSRHVVDRVIEDENPVCSPGLIGLQGARLVSGDEKLEEPCLLCPVEAAEEDAVVGDGDTAEVI